MHRMKCLLGDHVCFHLLKTSGAVFVFGAVVLYVFTFVKQRKLVLVYKDFFNHISSLVISHLGYKIQRWDIRSFRYNKYILSFATIGHSAFLGILDFNRKFFRFQEECFCRFLGCCFSKDVCVLVSWSHKTWHNPSETGISFLIWQRDSFVGPPPPPLPPSVLGCKSYTTPPQTSTSPFSLQLHTVC